MTSLLLLILLAALPAITDHFEAFIKYKREYSFKVLSVPPNLINTSEQTDVVKDVPDRCGGGVGLGDL